MGFQAVSPVVMKLLSNPQLWSTVKFQTAPSLGKHIESGYKEMVADVASTLTVEQVLEQPLAVPPTSLEKRAAGYLICKCWTWVVSQTIQVSTWWFWWTCTFLSFLKFNHYFPCAGQTVLYHSRRNPVESVMVILNMGRAEAIMPA